MSEDHPDYGDQTRPHFTMVKLLPTEFSYPQALRRLAELEHDLGALQAYCDLGLQERLAALEAKVAELESIIHGLQNVGPTTQASHPEA